MHYAWVIAGAGAVIVLFAHGLARMSYGVILPFMKEQLALNYTQIGLIATGNFIGYLLFTTFGGFLAARFGTRKVITISLFITGFFLFITGFANSFSFAFVARLITGIGNGGCFVPMMSLPAAWFVARKRGMAMGIVNIGVCMGLVLSGFLLPSCISFFGAEGWRWAWRFIGIGVVACAFLCWVVIRNNPAEKGLSMYGASAGDAQPPQVLTLFAAFRRVVGEKEVWKLSCVYLTYGFSYIIYVTFFVAFLTKEAGMTTAQAGAIFATIGVIAIFGGLLTGMLSDVIGRRYACICVYLTLALAYALPAFFSGKAIFYVSAVLFGLAFSVPVLMAAAAGDAVGGRLAPAALGLTTLVFAIGQIFGPYVGGYIKDATGTFTYSFMLCSAVAVAGALFSLLLKKKAQPETERGLAKRGPDEEKSPSLA